MAMQDLLKDIVICPECGGECRWSERAVTCSQCGSIYGVQDGIPYFLRQAQYWCNIPRREMQQVVDYVRMHGFQAGLRDRIPRYLHSAIIHADRADARFFLPIDKESVILDMGCMWGALTFALAEHCKHIVGLDQTLETLQLSYYRAQEAGIQNVTLLGGDAHRMPIKDNIFDVVILNGVLEWLGLEGEYVVEQQWGKRSRNGVKTVRVKNPRTLQLRGLQEALRVLKPGGTLWLAIENRVQAAYFLGVPDDHSGLPYNSLLPRKLANLYSLLAIGQPYRTYTYTIWGLRKLLREAGFVQQTFFTAFPSYEQPATILPLDSKFLEFYLINTRFKSVGGREKLMFLFLRLPGLSAVTVPDFIVTARKRGDFSHEGCNRTFRRIVFDNWSTLFPGVETPSEISLMKFKSRMEKGAPISFFVFSNADKRKPLGYLKVNRDKTGLAALMHDAEVYATIYAKCTESRRGLAEQMFSGHLDAYFVISRSVVNGQTIERRLLHDVGQRPKGSAFKKLAHRVIDRLLSLYGDSTTGVISFGEFAQRAIDWLILFNTETSGRTLTFETFWDRFAASRLASPRLKSILDVPTDILEAYRVTLKELANGLELRTGPIHADYNHYNILVSRESIAVVDWEYAEEESFPPFDALNLFAQPASECGSKQVETLFSSDPKDELASIANDLLARYLASQELSLEFIKACGPLFILDLLYRDYGFYGEGGPSGLFPLRSVSLLRKLISIVLGTG